MTQPLLSPIPEGTRWPSGESVDIAVLSLGIEKLADRIGLPLIHGFEQGLGSWIALGGRLPSGTDMEIICYLSFPNSVVIRVDRHVNYSSALKEALAQFRLSPADLKHVSPLLRNGSEEFR